MTSPVITTAIEHYITMTFSCSAQPEQVVANFTDPDAVRQWWGGNLHYDPAPGGDYIVSFPEENRTMAGKTMTVTDSEVWFTWSWVGQSTRARSVGVIARENFGEPGTQVSLRHGPFGETIEERAELEQTSSLWQQALTALHGRLDSSPMAQVIAITESDVPDRL